MKISRRTFSITAAAGLASLPLGGAWAGEARYPYLQGSMKPFVYFEPRQPAPMAPFLDETGRAVNVLAFYGEVVLVNFWATWCAHCVWELPQLDRLQGAFRRRGLRVAAVSIDLQGRAIVAPFYERRGIRNLDVFLDPDGRALVEFGFFHGLPVSYLIDRRGRLIGYMDGSAAWASENAMALVDHFLAEPEA